MSKKRMYFGRPINVFGSELDKLLIQRIQEAFPGYEIEDPNQQKHADGYQKYKEETGNGMDYYTEVVLPSCDAGIFLCFRDGTWGAGVFREALFFADEAKPIFEISPSGSISSPDLNLAHVLSVSETRMRIRNDKGETIPY
jgi:hypothetical protein